MASAPADDTRGRGRAVHAEPAEPELGDVLRRARVHHGLSLRDVERRTEIPNAHLSQIERGRIRRPEPAIVFTLAQLYGLNYGLLAEWAGYVDSHLPVDARLLDSLIRLFVGLDATGQDKALRFLEQLRSNSVHAQAPGATDAQDTDWQPL